MLQRYSDTTLQRGLSEWIVILIECDGGFALVESGSFSGLLLAQKAAVTIDQAW